LRQGGKEGKDVLVFMSKGSTKGRIVLRERKPRLRAWGKKREEGSDLLTSSQKEMSSDRQNEWRRETRESCFYSSSKWALTSCKKKKKRNSTTVLTASLGGGEKRGEFRASKGGDRFHALTSKKRGLRAN